MEITIFSKRRHTKEGKAFYSYLSTLHKKDGTDQIVSVRFREECGSPDGNKCPMNIKFDKDNANISTRTFTREDTGEIGTSHTLWISAWEKGSEYVDHSMDEFI